MSKPERSHLLDFLSKPRFGREIAEHFNLSPDHLDDFLQEAMKSGHVLISERQVPQIALSSQGKPEKPGDFLYISRNSSLLSSNAFKLAKQKAGKVSQTDSHLVSVKFLRKAQSHTHAENEQWKQRGSSLHRMAKITCGDTFHINSRKGLPFGIHKGVKFRTTSDAQKVKTQRSKYKRLANHSEGRSLSHRERLRLLRTISDQSLPFLDIHRRFGISKQVVKGFVKRGFFEEVWGPRNIGVIFKLTEKGEAHLKRLEKASHLRSSQQKRISIRLKHRVPS